QLEQGLALADKQKKIVVAYEPVWAIGTGRVATVEQVAAAHSAIVAHLDFLGWQNFAVLYGGSVKPENSRELLATPHVDGFLVGGASLELKSFLSICQP
ncbi:MAG: triose-phosphate isomerase, partial [Bdellovibrionaceae bacterium]|nr:triose-phosphate isomerase [Pseudobdellovibrionaceae bacterium]